ncbi:hypothetical protein [Akkermansia muciniphila]|uniref:hypothetical protein n=1 Tax=Akkermansia muciniphila TaxID=239935 RepID=UPI00122EE5FB|nr:hypothetical protein [Akkermansia muciniphila]KAA3384399.1 hypothetical protein F1912_12775 [Akkermansia muciniphila]
MDVKIANAMSGYIQTLYYMNKKLIKLCGLNAFINDMTGYKEMLDISQDIPRVIPYYWNMKNEKLELNDSNGLLEFSVDIEFLKSDYEYILCSNYEFLNKIRQIRNKHGHKMHDVKQQSVGDGSLYLFDFTVKINEVEICVCAGEFISLLKQINLLFSKIVKEISLFGHDQRPDSLYYQWITHFDFLDFNKLYDSDLLRTIGKIMYDF